MEDKLPAYKILQESPKLLPMLYQDIAHPSVKKVGQALGTVFELSNTILLPLKLINEKARLNFKKHIDTYKDKLEKIDSQKIIDISTIIGTPIIERLTYITNDEIAELYINLLAKASNSDTVNEAHPAFIHIIDRMSVDEARIIDYLNNKDYIPYISIISETKKKDQFNKLAWNLTGIENKIDLLSQNNIDLYLDNFISLNIIESQGELFKADKSSYLELKEIYKNVIEESNQWVEMRDDNLPVEIKDHFFEITELGRSFIKACVK